jgi:hypothetical protein
MEPNLVDKNDLLKIRISPKIYMFQKRIHQIIGEKFSLI